MREARVAVFSPVRTSLLTLTADPVSPAAGASSSTFLSVNPSSSRGEYAPLPFSSSLSLSSPTSGSFARDPPPPSPTFPGTFAPAFPDPPSSRARQIRRVAVLALFTLVTITLYLLFPASFTLPSSFSSLYSSSSPLPSCSARQYSSGAWIPKLPSLTPNTSVIDVLAASGYQGTSQEWFKPAWFFGSNEQGDWREMGEYRWKAAQWMWESAEEVCREEVGRTEGEELVKELVQKGGWILLGDSLSEQHFFSLGCVLFPHVSVTWGAGWWEQLMHLSPSSPLLSTNGGSLVLPPSFNLTARPLITNLRTDHGFTKEELLEIYESTPQALEVPSSSLFTDYPVQSPPVKDYLDRFFRCGAYENTQENYHALIFSTAAHFTPREFAFPGGQKEIQPFFEAVVANWTGLAEKYLEEDEEGRQVIVRAASSGHDECHEHFEPFEAEWPVPKSWNWAEIPRMNEAFETEIELAAHPRLNFLSLDRPGQLRPDAHSGDCLHFAVGTGVFEGWTDYLSYFLRGH